MTDDFKPVPGFAFPPASVLDAIRAHNAPLPPAPTPSATTRRHTLKVWPLYGNALDDGSKTFEFRKDDRTPRYEVGDLLHLREWMPGDFMGTIPRYTGREWLRRVTYVARGGVIPEGYCVMSIVPPASAPAATAGTETCAKCGFAKGHPLHDANRWPGRITTNHPHHGFVARDKMTLDDLSGYRPAAPTGEEAETEPAYGVEGWLLAHASMCEQHETLYLKPGDAAEYRDYAQGIRELRARLTAQATEMAALREELEAAQQALQTLGSPTRLALPVVGNEHHTRCELAQRAANRARAALAPRQTTATEESR